MWQVIFCIPSEGEDEIVYLAPVTRTSEVGEVMRLDPVSDAAVAGAQMQLSLRY